MKRKPIKVDWDALDEAFHRRVGEVDAYLDLVTGHVALEGEGDDDADEGDYAVGGLSTPPATRDDATRLAIRPPDTAEKIVWMRGFIESQRGRHDEVLDEIVDAIDTPDPATEIRDALNRHPEVRDLWYRYRADRIHERIDGWLGDHDVAVTDSPPWA